ncbi:hypothetical protein BU26DRAFT_135448 [Trematosphaeria pertusa]|uniref:Uncharacterized protein n=1 Tax=Trematosphaeria pertusa TaxID=390896 RepID=A0A6A6IWF2_9PLEO|nr:uncharacterized protein BU26DRAFT_135448 [Trematosphaeria pertusa]KAF2254262.1 hypothetical protein BU26DRAFT_135448 [Trematosphaeria pertusa]
MIRPALFIHARLLRNLLPPPHPTPRGRQRRIRKAGEGWTGRRRTRERRVRRVERRQRRTRRVAMVSKEGQEEEKGWEHVSGGGGSGGEEARKSVKQCSQGKWRERGRDNDIIRDLRTSDSRGREESGGEDRERRSRVSEALPKRKASTSGSSDARKRSEDLSRERKRRTKQSSQAPPSKTGPRTMTKTTRWKTH